MMFVTENADASNSMAICQRVGHRKGPADLSRAEAGGQIGATRAHLDVTPVVEAIQLVQQLKHRALNLKTRTHKIKHNNAENDEADFCPGLIKKGQIS